MPKPNHKVQLKKIHLTCALFNPKYRLTSINPPVFSETVEDSAEVMENCTICRQYVSGGIRCKKPGCKEVVHLRCALEKRAKILSKNAKEICDEELGRGQTYHYSNQFWNISYGLFKRIGRDPNDVDAMKITEEDLKTSQFYKEAS